MRRHTSIVEDRLIEWAMVKEQEPHNPAWQEVSQTYLFYTLGPQGMLSKSGIASDGGMYNAIKRSARDIKVRGRAKDVDQVINRMRRLRPSHAAVIVAAYLNQPGKIEASRVAALLLNMPEGTYKKKYAEAIAHVDGALLSVAA